MSRVGGAEEGVRPPLSRGGGGRPPFPTPMNTDTSIEQYYVKSTRTIHI